MANTEGFSKEELEKYMAKSKVDMYAQRGLGKMVTAVDGFIEMFSALLVKAGIDVDNFELERWLDTYYQLRYAAEREADLARFVAQQVKTADELRPVVPKVRCNIGPGVEDKEEKAKELRLDMKAAVSHDTILELGAAGKMLIDTIMKRFTSVD